jgi:hypothetical protein
MPPIEFLGKTKARLLAMGAIMAGGTLVSGALAASNPITGTALLSGTLAMAGSVAGGIFANDLGDLAKGLGENEEILNDRELTQAVVVGIPDVTVECQRTATNQSQSNVAVGMIH